MLTRKKRKKVEFIIIAVAILFYLLFWVYANFGLTPFIVIAVVIVSIQFIRWKLQPSSNYRQTAVEVLGRPLDRNEIVHHVNGNRSDNGVDNLCVMDSVKHELYHSWLRWKKEKSGHYPSPNQQRFILKDEYGGIILSEYRKTNEISILEKIKEEQSPKITTQETKKPVNDLYEELRRFRNKLAEERKIPPYLIFSNETLMELAERMPQTLDEFKDIKGVGPAKFKDYADLFLEKMKNK